MFVLFAYIKVQTTAFSCSCVWYSNPDDVHITL